MRRSFRATASAAGALALLLAAATIPASAIASDASGAAAAEADTAADAGPSAPVRRLTDALIATMKAADKLGFDGRSTKLGPVLRETFDFGFMARLSLGAQWGKLDAQEQARFTDLFARMSVATFAARFDGYGGQHFAVKDAREGPRGTRLVPTKLVHPDPEKAPVTISYLMRETKSGWRAVDVYLKGTYSELATKRSEYTSIVKRKGYPALVRTIEAKIAELRDDAAAKGKDRDGDARDGAGDGA